MKCEECGAELKFVSGVISNNKQLYCYLKDGKAYCVVGTWTGLIVKYEEPIEIKESD